MTTDPTQPAPHHAPADPAATHAQPDPAVTSPASPYGQPPHAPGYAPHPGAATAPGYAMPPGYAVPPGYAPSPGYAVPPGPQAAPAAPTGSGRAAGVVAAILGAVPLLFGFVQPFVIRFLALGSGDWTLYSLLSGVLGFITFAFGAAALIVGLIAIQRRGEPARGRLIWGGIGVGLGAAAVIGVLASLAYGAFAY